MKSLRDVPSLVGAPGAPIIFNFFVPEAFLREDSLSLQGNFHMGPHCSCATLNSSFTNSGLLCPCYQVMRGEITHFVIVIVIAGFPCFNQTRKGCNSCVYGSINIICEEVSAAGACRCSRICIRISSGAPCPSAHLCGFSIRQPIKIARKLFRRFSELLQPCIKKHTRSKSWLPKYHSVYGALLKHAVNGILSAMFSEDGYLCTFSCQ